MIPQKVIEEIRERTDIVQIIGSMLELKKSGSNYKALCPFHGEKTPSFMVSPDKQIYHCFGCGKGGNVFHFLMEYEGVGFVEAVRNLGREIGIDVDKYLGTGEGREKRDRYYSAMEFAARFYHKALLDESGRIRGYLQERDIDDDLCELFGIGYAPAGWDHLYKAALEAGHGKDTLIDLNLVMRSRGGSGYRDYFRNRIIFPIAMLSNRVVGLAGRVLDRSEPKYLNTTESPIYSKGRILYGLNKGKDAIRKSGSAIVVEGYVDYLMLWKKGIRNICAVCGTSLTEEQARLLARYAKRVYIINDGDRAGIRAAVRAADQFIIHGLEAFVVKLPEGEDPDSFVRKQGEENLHDLMQASSSYFIYLKNEAESGSHTTFRKRRVIEHLLGTISRVDDGVRKELYLQEVSGLFDIPVETLRGGLRKIHRFKRTVPGREKTTESKRVRFQKQLFRIGLESEEYAGKIIGNLIEEDLEGVLFRQYYKALDLALKNHIDIKSPDFIGAIEDPDLCQLASEIALLPLPPGPHEDYVKDTLIWLKKAALRDEMEMMKKRIEQLQAEHGPGSGEEIEIVETYRKVTRELKKLGLKGENQFG